MPRQPSEDALIWQMARKSYEARQRYLSIGGQWGSLSQGQRDIEFDAMWHALHELLVPTSEMISAMACSRALDDEGPFLPLLDLIDFSGENKLHTVLRAASAAMINKLLEV